MRHICSPRRLAAAPNSSAVASFVRVQAGARVAERHDAGAGERRVVDEEVGLERARVGERVGEDQAALGVGVDDLDGLAVERGQTSPGR